MGGPRRGSSYLMGARSPPGERAGPMLARFSSVMTATSLCLTLDHIGGGLCGIAGSYALHDYLNNHVAWLERPARHGAVDRRERAHRVDAGRPRHLLYEVGPDGRSAADLLLVPPSGACAWQVGSQTGASRSESERWRLVSRGGRCRSPPPLTPHSRSRSGSLPPPSCWVVPASQCVGRGRYGATRRL